MSASSTEEGEAREVIQCNVESVGAKVGFIGLNRDYVLEMLGTIGKGQSIKLLVKDESCAVLGQPISEQEYKTDYVIMAMRL